MTDPTAASDLDDSPADPPLAAQAASPAILLAGASVRAAAFSARRAGYQVRAADMFGDLDLQEVATTTVLAPFPAALTAWARTQPAGPWSYCGALENHPRLIAELAAERPLWGSSAASVQAVRDPRRLAETLTAAGCRTPPCWPPLHNGDVPGGGLAAPPPAPWGWLRKPLDSAGGRGMQRAATPDAADPDRWYWQPYLPGRCLGAAFVGCGRGSRLLGLAESWRGLDWAGAGDPFWYGGSLAPAPASAALRSRIQRVGDCLASRCGLRGWFGVDLVVRGDEPLVLEVNPRFTASMELLDRLWATAPETSRWSVFGLHAEACRPGASGGAAAVAEPPRTSGRCSGKVVLYAESECVAGEALGRWARQLNGRRPPGAPTVADLPVEGQVLPAGGPVVSLLADGPTPADVRRELQRLCRLARTVLAKPGPG